MTDFQTIYREADAAGKKAADACVPRPMVVGSPTTLLGNDIDRSKPTYYVADGVCGFAWVAFKGNTPWGRWAKKQGVAKPNYPSGLSIWIGDYGQSMERKAAYARAFAGVLQQHGIKDAYSSSRMD